MNLTIYLLLFFFLVVSKLNFYVFVIEIQRTKIDTYGTNNRRERGSERQTGGTIELTKQVIRYPEPQVFEIWSQLSCISITCKCRKNVIDNKVECTCDEHGNRIIGYQCQSKSKQITLSFMYT